MSEPARSPPPYPGTAGFPARRQRGDWGGGCPLSPPTTVCSGPPTAAGRSAWGGGGTVTRHIPGLGTTPQPRPDAARAPIARACVTWPARRPGDWPPPVAPGGGGAAREDERRHVTAGRRSDVFSSSPPRRTSQPASQPPAGASRKWAGHFRTRPRPWLPIGQRALRPAPSGGEAVGPLEGRDWPDLQTPVTWPQPGWLHELGAGPRRPARRRGHAAPVVSLDARAAAGGFPPSVATPSLAVHGFWKPSPALSGLGLRRLRSRISFCSLCHLSQRKSRQGDRQGRGREAPSSLRQPHPADHFHVSPQWEGLRAFPGGNLSSPRLFPSFSDLLSYEWKGKIEEDSEVLMMIKTQSSLVPALTEFVRSVHPYEVAEVIALPVEQGNPPYLHWVRQVTESVSDSGTAPSSA